MCMLSFRIKTILAGVILGFMFVVLTLAIVSGPTLVVEVLLFIRIILASFERSILRRRWTFSIYQILRLQHGSVI